MKQISVTETYLLKGSSFLPIRYESVKILTKRRSPLLERRTCQKGREGKGRRKSRVSRPRFTNTLSLTELYSNSVTNELAGVHSELPYEADAKCLVTTSSSILYRDSSRETLVRASIRPLSRATSQLYCFGWRARFRCFDVKRSVTRVLVVVLKIVVI